MEYRYKLVYEYSFDPRFLSGSSQLRIVAESEMDIEKIVRLYNTKAYKWPLKISIEGKSWQLMGSTPQTDNLDDNLTVWKHLKEKLILREIEFIMLRTSYYISSNGDKLYGVFGIAR